MKHTKKRAKGTDRCYLRIYPLPGGSLWIGRVLIGEEQVGVTTTCDCPDDVFADADQQGFELDMVIEHRNTGNGKDPFSIVRLHAALEGSISADSLTSDERALFDKVLNEVGDSAHALNESLCADTTHNIKLKHLLTKACDARDGGQEAWCVQTTSEKLAVALTLNRFDWLQEMGCTIAEAIEHVGPQWVGMIPAAAKAIHNQALAQ